MSVLSKLLEPLVARQLLDYLNSKRLLPDPQSAYRANHSTETAVTKVLGDSLLALDGDLTMLTLLDLSAALDTVDHETLIQRQEVSFGLRGTVLGWFKSYLDDRTQYVRCGSSTSTPARVTCGIPHSRVRSWTNSFSAVYGGLNTTDRESQPSSTRIRRRYLRLLS